ncbi:MAG: HAD family phosphatase, partial [Candidatus Marinimicrobia bacterium]|nr:HAD family phosphatase [Candidatus Neomarinimicrobiota bacterium]
DFDGIVVDSEPLYEKAMSGQFRRYGIRVDQDDWLFFKGKDSKAVFAYLREKYDSRINIDELHAAYKKDLLEEFRRHMRFIPGFPEFFHACKAQFQDILVTSTSREVMEWTFKNVPVGNIFSDMITANEVQNTKPHPEPYLRAAERIGIPIDRCVVMEDSLNGIRAGKAAGAKVIAMTTTFRPGILKEADLIVNSYGELSPERLIALIRNTQ